VDGERRRSFEASHQIRKEGRLEESYEDGRIKFRRD